jgi:hypothetical protein
VDLASRMNLVGVPAAGGSYVVFSEGPASPNSHRANRQLARPLINGMSKLRTVWEGCEKPNKQSKCVEKSSCYRYYPCEDSRDKDDH